MRKKKSKKVTLKAKLLIRYVLVFTIKLKHTVTTCF